MKTKKKVLDSRGQIQELFNEIFEMAEWASSRPVVDYQKTSRQIIGHCLKIQEILELADSGAGT